MTKKKNLKLNNAAGFSLVELMVVVAIIGILASVAVPQFQKLTYKARLVEAKAGLSSLYTSEKAFYGEWSQYDQRFEVIGYAPEGTYYFNIGFDTGGTNADSTNWLTAGNSPPSPVHSATKGFCSTNTTKCKSMASASASAAGIPTGAKVNNPTGSAANFTGVAMAAGTLHPSGTLSELSIDENKNLKQSSGGI